MRRGAPPAPTPSATPSPACEQVRAEVEERHWARTEQIIAEEADLATLLSARAAAEVAAPTAYSYEHALASAASAACAISADEMESELEQAKAQLVAARRQSELARASLGARLQHSSPSNTPRTPVTPLLCASLAPPHESSPEREYATQARYASRVTPAPPPCGTEGRPPRRHRSRPASRRRYRAAPRHLEPSCTIAAHIYAGNTPNCFVCGVAFCKSTLYPRWRSFSLLIRLVPPFSPPRVVAKSLRGCYVSHPGRTSTA